MSDSSSRSPVHPFSTLEYRCGGCGYGIRVSRLPESCPMCHASVTSWIRVLTHPALRNSVGITGAG
jgi:rubrerythrin